MSNRGVLPGLDDARWKDYQPEWKATNFGTGGAVTTQPDVGNGTLTGRFIRHPSGIVVANIVLVGGSTTVWGSTADFYIWKLPVTASRSNSGADLPIGSGYVTQGTGGSTQWTQPVVPTLADPGSTSQGFCRQSDEDNWIQGFANRACIAAGTFSISTGSTSTTITHNAGVTSGFVPSAYDFIITPTNSASTNPKSIYVDTITATQANINVGASSATTGQTGAWKIRGEPNSTGGILVQPGMPFAGAEGTVFGFQCIYEARR